MRRLSPPVLDELRRRIARAPEALPFAEAVAGQLAHPPGARGDAAAEWDALERVTRALAGEGELADDPALLAAVFQNVDLLYEHRYAEADAMSLRVMRALERAEPEP